MPQTLEYAAPRDAAAPWGPVLVRPSRRSVLLLLITAAVAAWVGLRHEPWVPGGTASLPVGTPAPGRALAVLHLQDEFLLAHDPDAFTIRVWDAATGRLVRTFGQESGVEPRYLVGYYVADRGRAIFARSLGRNYAELLDPPTGRVLKRADGNPPPGRILGVGPGLDPVVLYAEETAVADGKVNNTTFGLWRPFDGAAHNPVHTFSVAAAAGGRLSPDGRTVLVTSDAPMPMPPGMTPEQRAQWEVTRQIRGRSELNARLYDVETGKLLADLTGRSVRSEPVFSGDGRVLVSVYDPNPSPPWAAMVYARTGPGNSVVPVPAPPPPPPPPTTTTTTTSPTTAIERHDTRTGALLSSVPAPPALTRLVPFADGGHALFVPYSVAGGPVRYWSSVIDLRKPSSSTASGGTPRLGPFIHYAAAMPDGRRMLLADGSHSRGGIYDADFAQPLARVSDVVGDVRQADVSPDGRRLAVTDNDHVHLYRKVGFECRESHFGVLGMPHVWLLGGLLIALAFSLRADARRSQSATFVSRSGAAVGLVMLVLALPRTFHAVLAGVTGEWLMTPAPLLLVCAIGLCAGGRFWRLATLVVLACLLPLDAYCTFDLRRAGFGTPYRLEVIDRTFEIPRVIVFAMMAVLAGLIAPALVLLVRPGRGVD